MKWTNLAMTSEFKQKLMDRIEGTYHKHLRQMHTSDRRLKYLNRIEELWMKDRVPCTDVIRDQVIELEFERHSYKRAKLAKCLTYVELKQTYDVKSLEKQKAQMELHDMLSSVIHDIHNDIATLSADLQLIASTVRKGRTALKSKIAEMEEEHEKEKREMWTFMRSLQNQINNKI